MNLGSLSDRQLLNDLIELASQEREMLSVIVRYLDELEFRRLHLTEGYPSAFAFCTEVLKYSESEAISRIRAARLIREVPIALRALESGQLSLSVASRAHACFYRERKAGIVAERKEAIVQELMGKKIEEADRILAFHFPGAPPREYKISVDGELTKLQFGINSVTRDKLEKILSLRSHTNPSKRLDLLFDDFCNLGLKNWDPAYSKARKVSV